MGRGPWGVATGVAVFVTGWFAVVTLTASSNQPAVEAPPPPSTSVATGEPEAAGTEGLPGVGIAVTRVLRWSGNAELASAADLAQLPPSVARVLIEFGTPLMVPTTSERLP